VTTLREERLGLYSRLGQG